MAKKTLAKKKVVKKLSKAEATKVAELMTVADKDLKKAKDDIEKEIKRRRDERRHILLHSEEYKALKAERRKLAEEGEDFDHEVILDVPIRLFVRLSDNGDYDLVAAHENGIMYHNIEGELADKAKFSARQAKLLNEHIIHFVDRACDDIDMFLTPSIKAAIKDLENKYKDFINRVKKAGLELWELEN